MSREPIGGPETHSDKMPIEQRPQVDPDNYDGDVLVGERIINVNYAEELAFNEEPVTIRLEPSTEKNAVSFFPVWVNGKGAEVFQNGRWVEVGWLPIDQVITVKRKVVEVIARAKIDTINHTFHNHESERPDNRLERRTSAVYAFSILEDRNPKGVPWITEIRRRNF